jgi:PilZ domain
MTITADFLPPQPAIAPATGRDRRRFTRHRLAQPLPALIGRSDGILVDISANGTRVRHASPVVLSARVRITFVWGRERFEATAEVLASRMVALKADARFESRLRFVSIEPASQEVLARMLSDLMDRDLRKWVANLHGWGEESASLEEDNPPAGYIRCRFVSGRWQQTPTRDTATPLDGFIVPAGTAPAEIRSLCRTWESSDAEGRTLVRLITEAVVKR